MQTSHPASEGPIVGRAPGTRALRFGLLLVAIGLVLVGIAVNGGWDFINGLFTADQHPVPGVFEEELKGDTTYVISIQTSSSVRAGPITSTRTRSIAVQRLVVIDPDGRAVTARADRHQTINRNGTEYSGVALLDTTVAGVYRIELDTSAPTTALVTRSLTDLDAGDVVWMAAGPIGALLVLGGGVSAVVGFVRRRSSHRNPFGSPPSPVQRLPPPPPGIRR